MPRPPRRHFQGAVHHVLSRGNERRRIFADDRDYRAFLFLLDKACRKFKLQVWAYCLMPNHIHLLLHTPQGNLSKGLQWLLGVYSMRFNKRHERVGHVFQGRFKSPLVQEERGVLEVSRYIHLNPVRAALVAAPERYPWSSFKAIMEGHRKGGPVLASFSTRQAYRDFVLAGLLEQGPGCKGLRWNMDPRVSAALAEALEGCRRDAAMLAWWRNGLEQKRIAKIFGLSPAQTCRILRSAEVQCARDESFRTALEKARAALIASCPGVPA